MSSAFRKCSKYRNAVFALFAAPRGSQDRVVRNAGQARLLELFADAPTQIRIRFNSLPGHAFGIKLADRAASAFKRRFALTATST